MGAFGRVIKLVCLFCKHLFSKKTLQDGLHQLGITFLFPMLTKTKSHCPLEILWLMQSLMASAQVESSSQHIFSVPSNDTHLDINSAFVI